MPGGTPTWPLRIRHVLGRSCVVRYVLKLQYVIDALRNEPLVLQRIHYKITLFRVVMLSCIYLPIGLVLDIINNVFE